MPGPMLLRDQPAAYAPAARTSARAPARSGARRRPSRSRPCRRAPHPTTTTLDSSSVRSDADPPGRTKGEHEHQRVTRACPERCAEIEGRADGDERRFPPRAPRSERRGPPPTAPATASTRTSTLDEEPDQDRVRDRPHTDVRTADPTRPRAPADRRRCSPSRSSVLCAPRAPGGAHPTARGQARTRAGRRCPRHTGRGRRQEPGGRAPKPPRKTGGARIVGN